MKKSKSIQLKAAILLIVFSCNTIIGFACGIGVDMSFKSKNDNSKKAIKTTIHVHADGKKHIHHEKAGSVDHNKTQEYKRNVDEKSNKNKESCCTSKVTKFEQLDKLVPQSIKVHSFFYTTFVSSFFAIANQYTSYIDTRLKYFVRSHHPPIPDLRIAIQSFQI